MRRLRFFRVFGLLLAVVVAGCIWWQLRKSTEPKPQPRAVTVPAGSSATPSAIPPSATTPRSQTNVPAPPALTSVPPRLIAKPRAEIPPPDIFPRPAQDVFETQLALARRAISPGSLDGMIGPQTRAALRAFQEQAGLRATGEVTEETKARLLLTEPPCASCTVTSNDLARLQPLSTTWLGKSQQSALAYETILELVAEKGHAHPNLIRRLNPDIDWTNVVAGTTVQIPNIAYPNPQSRAALVVIFLAEKVLQVFDADTNLLAQFPCSIAQRVEKRPVGELHVAVIAPNPNYTFDPAVFPESPEARQLQTRLVLPPGPNNPVGVAWIGLDRPGYGIHGTPGPEQVGRTESHGCFRLANWNAEYLLKLVWVGMPVYVEP